MYNTILFDYFYFKHGLIITVYSIKPIEDAAMRRRDQQLNINGTWESMLLCIT